MIPAEAMINGQSDDDTGVVLKLGHILTKYDLSRTMITICTSFTKQRFEMLGADVMMSLKNLLLLLGMWAPTVLSSAKFDSYDNSAQ